MTSLLVTPSRSSRLNLLTVDQFKQLPSQRAWLSPADPSTDHNIARKAHNEGTAVWFCEGGIFIEWKSTGSLLWIHGKPGSGKTILCSAAIQDIMVACEAGSAMMAYFYFDARDLNKQTCHDLLRSLVSQLSTSSSPCCDILHQIYRTHKDGTQQPSDETLMECLKEMLKLPRQGPVFIILDALDECPQSPRIPSPRNEVLKLVKELVDLHLQELHICATSRPEVDIRAVLEPLAFHSVSLHDESGKNTDIADYVRSVVNSTPSTAMRTWRAEDKDMVIKTLTERADGMFRWVSCQLGVLQHCFPPNLHRYLNEFPKTLDETYERILKGINEVQRDDAHRLLQCLTVAARPLRVEEIAELLSFDFQASSSGGIPKLEDWRWNDHEEALLSTCSSLITIVPSDDSRVVQFSHFSVKEYLKSPRLARSHGDVSRFHIDLDTAHTIMAQACLRTLLRLGEHTGKSGFQGFPLVEYAARYWVEHAQFESVSSRVRNEMDDLFEGSKPHFAAWLQVHDMDERWQFFASKERDGVGSPLYYAAFCGFYDLVERLVTKHPEQVNARGGLNLAPLQAALFNRHFRVANLLHKHSAVVDIQDGWRWTLLHAVSRLGSVDIMRWLLDHGASASAQAKNRYTPLHLVARHQLLEAAQVLLEHNPDINSQDYLGEAPLHDVSDADSSQEGVVVEIARRLLEHGADPNMPNRFRSTPLHQASSKGWLEVARLLLSYGAKVDEKDRDGQTPFQVASSKGYHELTKLLVENGAIPPP